jgi:nucleotide-binding universal stress UspA family protein
MKDKIKRILCPIDFSDAANNAIEYAARLTKQLDASLMLWNMQEMPIIDEMAFREAVSNGVEEKRRQLVEILEDWCQEIKETYHIPCGYYVNSSTASLEQTLAYYTNEENFDLIVVGTNGADDIYQFFFGSNSYRIAKEVNMSILVVPEKSSLDHLSSVVFATNYSKEDALLACDFMKLFQTDLKFLHLSKYDTGISEDVFHAFKEECQERLAQDHAIRFERLVCQDKLEGLNEVLQRERIDLMILSTVHRNWLENLFHKSFTKEVLAGLQIPTLILHPTGEEEHKAFSLSLKEE